MKSAKEILDETIVSGFIKNNTLEQSIIEAMKEYAKQAIDLCEENAQTTESPAYNTIVDKRSILNMKKLLK